VRAGDVRAEAGARGERPEERELLGLALDRHRLERLVLEHPFRPPVGLLRDRDPVDRRRPCRREAVLTTSAVTLPSPCSGRAPSATTASPVLMPKRTCKGKDGVCLVQLLDRLEDAKPRPHRALGVVLVCRGGSEHGHDRVADELLDGAAVPLELLAQARVVRADAGANILGVCAFGSGGEADEIAEES
jgi:hypothetical protein